MNKVFFYLSLIVIFNMVSLVVAEENITVNDTNSTNIIDNSSVNNTNSTIDNSTNVTIPENVTVPDIVVTNFLPKEFKVGDASINIQVLNNKNETLTNLIASVSGPGFSTYDVVPIDSLSPGEKDYIFVNGNFKQAGNITLSIRVRDSVFYQNVSVVSPENLNDEQKAEEQRKEVLLNLSYSLSELEKNYNALEDELSNKSDDDYDVSKVSLDDLRKFIRDTQASILSENIGEAKKNLNLADQEYLDQKNIVDNLKVIPFIQRTKDYAVIFSAIVGALLMFFTLAELLRRKGEGIFSGFRGRLLKKKEEAKEKKKDE